MISCLATDSAAWQLFVIMSYAIRWSATSVAGRALYGSAYSDSNSMLVQSSMSGIWKHQHENTFFCSYLTRQPSKAKNYRWQVDKKAISSLRAKTIIIYLFILILNIFLWLALTQSVDNLYNSFIVLCGNE